MGRIGLQHTRAAFILCLAMAVGGLLIHSSASLAQSTPADAAAMVDSYITSHDQGCGQVKIMKTVANATYPSEVIGTRPAGYDVQVTLSLGSGYRVPMPPSAQANFLVSGGYVFPDDPSAGALAVGCRRDPSAPQYPLDWHALPYLNVSNAQFVASAGPEWHGAIVNRRFGAAIPGDNGLALWAPTCSAGSQTVYFHRTLYLLGPADYGTVTMAGYSATRTTLGGPLPFTLMQLRINGQVAFSTTNPSGASGQLTAGGLAAIRYGPNSVEVVVTKRATGPCNGKHNLQYAVEFAFNGSFHSDGGGSSGKVSGSGSCTSSSCIGRTSIPFTLSNLGPATMLEPLFVMNWTFTDPNTVDYFSIGVPCTTVKTDSRHYQAICEGAPFQGGRTGTIDFHFGWELPPQQSLHETWTYTWSFPGVVVGRGSAASGSGTVTVCSPPGPNCSAPVT